MFTERYEIKTHEQWPDGFVAHLVETVYNKKQLNERIYALVADLAEAEKSGHKIYAMDIYYYAEITLFGLIPIKEAHEKIFHWSCYKN